MLKSKIEQLLHEIRQNIGGEWLLTGGSLVQLVMEEGRATEDIDIVGMGHRDLSDTLAQNELFKAAIRIGLSPENVNSAASFFVFQVPGWRENILKLSDGPKGTIYRPTLNLFMVLKLSRASEIDLLDIDLAVKTWGLQEFKVDEFQKMASPQAWERFEKYRQRWSL